MLDGATTVVLQWRRYRLVVEGLPPASNDEVRLVLEDGRRVATTFDIGPSARELGTSGRA